MRARVLIFIGALLVIAALPIPGWCRLPAGCAVYLAVVLPAIGR